MGYRRTGWDRFDVKYYVPDRKAKYGRKIVAGSTKATNDLLVIVHEEYPTFTIKQLKALLTDRTQFIYNPEAVAVLDAHIKAGHGDRIPNWK
jgi:hypothetical protein